MPVTVNSMAAAAPARAWTRRSPNRRARAFLPSPVTVGLVIRSMTGLTSTIPWPAVSVCSSRSLIARALACSPGRLDSIRRQPRSSGELTTVSMRSATPSFKYCFTREFLQDTFRVTMWQYRSMAVRNPPRAGGASAPLPAAEQQLDVLRPAQVHVLAQKRLEERPGVDVFVEDQGAGGLHLPHRQLPPVPGVPVGVIKRERDPGHPPLEPHLHRAGAEPVADLLQPGRVVAGGDPVGQRGE